MAEIRWTEEALRCLRDIHDYIAADNPAAAQKAISGIYEKAQVLRRFPEIGHKYRAELEGDVCNGQEEHDLWESITRFLGGRPEQRKRQINHSLKEIEQLMA